MKYRHRYVDGSSVGLPVGKVVCVGRNYSEHVHELRNPMPETPLLFMKPSTALVSLEEPIHLPVGRGCCQHEIELAVLIGQQLSRVEPRVVYGAVAGFAIALDLTLRELQTKLKARQQPWEMAKAFDGACPISPFVRPEAPLDPQNMDFSLTVDGQVRQRGNTRQMMWGIADLVAYISDYFTLLPGDVVLTGTPAGVAELNPGEHLQLNLADRYCFETAIV